ncbi:MAG: OmpA family protein [bacterium]
MRLRPSFVALLVTLAAVFPARASENPEWSFGVLGGVVHYSDRIVFPRATMENGPAIGFRLSRAIGDYWRLEGASDLASTREDRASDADDLTIGNISIALSSQLSAPNQLGMVYVLGGVGYTRYHSGRFTDRQVGTFEAGVGWRKAVNDRMSVRIEARNLLDLKHGNLAASNEANQQYWAGLTYDFNRRPKDSDGDGVPDKKDRCAATPAGATVNADGCPSDSDADGVYDGLDQCPDTPKGATVDAKGCPSDSDGDGVLDGLDQCADTPKGATVGASGCPSDTDADGVLDGLDACPDTPKGATVDAKGCPSDSDADGVYDGLDQCPGTPANLKVDDRGCPIVSVERETELLDTGMIRLRDVRFESAKARILPDAYPLLDEVGVILSRWPQLRIEIGGHTDSRGSDRKNQALSEARAASVKAYLVERFPGIAASQITTRGYGESKPVSSNRTAQDMAKNRRVEFKVMNRDILKKEIEQRKLLQK